MPNYVRCRLVFDEGKAEEVAKQHIQMNDDGYVGFDFNTIIPMPKSLHMEVGSRSHHALKYYLACKNPDCAFLGKSEDKLSKEEYQKLYDLMTPKGFTLENNQLTEEEFHKIEKLYKDDLPALYEQGKTMVENKEKYGETNWHAWRVKNWGTKWNAVDTVTDGNVIEFSTAWNAPEPVIKKLGEMHKDLRIAMVYADEDIGNNTGFLLMEYGRVRYEGMFPDRSKWAMKFATELWNLQDRYVFDRAKDNYVERKNDKRAKSMPEPELA